MTPPLSLALHVACLVLAAARAEPVPAPGRVPKVYNALITSNQNLEPSKAYPVYQPVLHDAFAFPYSPVFYSDYPVSNGLFPAPGAPPKTQPSAPAAPAPSDPEPSSVSPPAPSEPPSEEEKPSPENSPSAPEEKSKSDDRKPTPAPPLPPNTQSPIPLNEFGLPPQVLPLGRIDPAYNGFTQVGPFTYTYPSFRFYDPYDPFGFNPYANLPPLYRPLANSLAPPSAVVVPGRAAAPAANAAPAASASLSEPSDLNLLNYSSKDPAIPNVPPPPLPLGGLKTDKSQ